MGKTIDQYWMDWENDAFPYGYGSGEPHTVPAVKKFLHEITAEGCYDFRELEKSFGQLVTWLLINRLCHLDVIEYGISPRFGFLTKQGLLLKEYMEGKTEEELVELAGNFDDSYAPCAPDYCNCDGGGDKCGNPFWR